METRPNVLYLSPDGLTDFLGQSQILPYVCGLTKNYAFTIVSFEKPGKFEREGSQIASLCSKSDIQWVPLTYHNKPPFVSTLFDLWVLRNRVRELHREHNFDIVHCRSYVTSLIGLWLKRKFKVKFLFDMRGFWPDERIEGGIWSKSNALQKAAYSFFKRKELEFLKNANAVISLTENAKHVIRSWNISTDIFVIPTCTDLTLFDPSKIDTAETLSLRQSLGFTKETFVLVYLGSWGTWYLTQNMLEFFSVLKARNQNAKFLILSADKIELENYPHKEDVVLRTIKRTEVPHYLSTANLAVAFVKPSFSKKASSATKIGELLAMNLPVIVNSGWGDIDILEYQGLIKIKDFSTATLELALDKALQTSLGKGTLLRMDTTNLALSNGIKLYDQVYKKILGGEPDAKVT
jgi:glycosyltransferase involved in cell wall biosynthesis